MSKIVCLGSACQDIYLIDRDGSTSAQVSDESIFNKLQLGMKVDVEKIAYKIGGGGMNSALSFARHGHETIFLGNIARDVAGEAVLTALDKEGVNSSYISFSKEGQTGCSIILLDMQSGKRAILNYSGVSAQFSDLSEDDLDLIRPDWLYITSLNGDFKTLGRFLEKAHSVGCKVMFNPGLKELEQIAELKKTLKNVDILLLNKAEATKIVPDGTLYEILANLKQYVKTTIVTDGVMGGIATDSVKSYRFGLYDNQRAKDANGAGDAFGSGFLAHFSAGNDFEQSLIFAAANASAVVRQIGAGTEILSGEEELHPMLIQEVQL